MADDPKGYYRILGLHAGSSTSDIKIAYRKLAKDWHPDTNHRPEAKSMFQAISEAYEILSRPARRALYDASAATPEVGITAPSPVRCCRCQEISAQPRYVVFWWVVSLVIVCQRSYLQGIFCSKCADKEALKASLKTWCLGWWSLYGILYSIWSIYQNLKGGQRPAEINARLLAQQAVYFVTQRHRPDLAIALLDQALSFSPSGELLDNISLFRQELIKDSTSSPRLKSNWRLFRRSFYLQAAPIILAGGLLFFVTANSESSVEWVDLGTLKPKNSTEKEYLFAERQYSTYNNYKILGIKITDSVRSARLTARFAFDCNGHAAVLKRVSYNDRGDITSQEAHEIGSSTNPAPIYDATQNAFFSYLQRYVCH